MYTLFFFETHVFNIRMWQCFILLDSDPTQCLCFIVHLYLLLTVGPAWQLTSWRLPSH